MIPVGTSIEVREYPAAVIGIIAANVGLFLLMAAIPPQDLDGFLRSYALVPAHYTDPASVHFDPFNPLPLIVNAFLHVGFVHLVVNMWTLWLFGRVLEDHIGTWRFVVLYLCGSLAADAAHIATHMSSTIPALGASGAVAAVMAAVVVKFPASRITLLIPIGFFPLLLPMPVIVFGGLWFGLQVLSGVGELGLSEAAPGIAWWAHIGGFVAGPVLAVLLGRPAGSPRVIGEERAKVQLIGAQRVRAVNLGTGKRKATSTPPRRFPGRQTKGKRSVDPEKVQNRTASKRDHHTPARGNRRSSVPITHAVTPNDTGPDHRADGAAGKRPSVSLATIALFILKSLVRTALRGSSR